jgi:RNase P/RNase MRP subunit p29
MKKDASILIGKHIEIDGSFLKGKVIDETKHTLTIQTQKGEKKVIKNNHSFIINGAKIPGEKLLGRIEERIKS